MGSGERRELPQRGPGPGPDKCNNEGCLPKQIIDKISSSIGVADQAYNTIQNCIKYAQN